MNGRLIAIEGLDGCGKTTASRGLAERLGAAWATTPGEEIRAVRGAFDAGFSRSLAASSVAYGASVIEAGARAEAWLREGRDVVIDRYWLSTLVYAPVDALPVLGAMEDQVRPADLTLYLWAPLAVRRARLAARGEIGGHDRRTLDDEVDRRLDRSFRSKAGNACAGAFVAVPAAGGPEEVLAELSAAVARHGPPQVPLFANR